MPGIAIGVDTGKSHHQAAAVDQEHGRVLGQLRFRVDRSGFERFCAFVQAQAGAEAVTIGLEATGHYHLTLLELLEARGYRVVLLNPYQVLQFRRSQGKRAKTDRLDARAIAQFVAVTAPLWIVPTSRHLAGLRELTRFRAELVHDRTMLLNRLHAAVDLAFPELLQVLPDLTGHTAQVLLSTYPTAAAVAAADAAALGDLLHRASHGHFHRERVSVLLETARASIGLQRGQAALAIKVSSLVRQVIALTQEIADLDQAIASEFDQLGYRVETFPAGGSLSLATIVAEAGDVGRFRTAKQVLAHFGWCPADHQSGASKRARPRLSRAGNRCVRRMIWMLAIHTVSRPGPFRDYFHQRTLAGKNNGLLPGPRSLEEGLARTLVLIYAGAGSRSFTTLEREQAGAATLGASLGRASARPFRTMWGAVHLLQR
jgi:transposase